MFEELFKSNKTFKTIHPRILRTSEKSINFKKLEKLINLLFKTVEQNDFKLIKKTLCEFDKDFRFSKKTNDFSLKPALTPFATPCLNYFSVSNIMNIKTIL